MKTKYKIQTLYYYSDVDERWSLLECF